MSSAPQAPPFLQLPRRVSPAPVKRIDPGTGLCPTLFTLTMSYAGSGAADVYSRNGSL